MSAALPNTTELSSPSYAQRHQGQLEDYDLLLSSMRAREQPANTLAMKLLRPSRYSPMDLDSQTAQEALKALEVLYANENKSALVIESYSSNVPSATGNWVATTTLPPLSTNNPQWRLYKDALDNAVQSLGGTIRRDGLFPLQQMALYYGIAPWDPQNTTQHQSVIDTLEEKRACHSLELENGLDLDELRRPVSSKDRKAYDSIRKSAPHLIETLTFERYLAKRTNTLIIETVRDFLPQQTSLIGYLSDEVDAKVALETMRAKPSVYLEKLLKSPKAQALANLLIKALDWYGERPGEQTSPAMRAKLVCRAIRLHRHAPSGDAPQETAGYDWRQSAHWGKSYQSIRIAFEAHLLSTRRVATANEAVILARLYQSQLTKDFAVHDVPAELPYRSSVVWVNFMHGVLLSDAMGSGWIQRQTFQQLVNLPMALSTDASAEELEAIAFARLVPTIHWAVTQGIIPDRADRDYSQDELERASKALDAHSQDLQKAIVELDVPPPERLKMAKQEMANLFGSKTFTSDGRKLVVQDKTRAAGGFRSTPLLDNPRVQAFTFLDVYAGGKFDNGEIWGMTGSDGKSQTDRIFKLGNERELLTSVTANTTDHDRNGFFIFSSRAKKLPDVNKLFESAFDLHIASIKGAYESLIISQIASLPLAERQLFKLGKLRMLALRKETENLREADETEDIIRQKTARMGFLLQIIHERKTYFYELFPRAGTIRQRPDLTLDMTGAVRTTAEFEGWFFGEKFDAPVLRGKQLPLDWSAYANGTAPKKGASCRAILEQRGAILLAPSATTGESVDPSGWSRFKEIAQLVSSNHLYVDEKQLRTEARGRTAFDEIESAFENKLDTVKSFIPFWGSIEDLMSGDTDRIYSGLLGLMMDLTAFALPIGKFVSGSVRLVKLAGTASVAGRLGSQATLPSFSTLTRKLLVSTVQNLNPLDGMQTLLASLGKGVLWLGKFGARKVRTLAGVSGQYNFIQGFAQATTPGRWMPLNSGDQLATVKAVDDVPVRNVPHAGSPRHYLVDPLSSLPYGPQLTTRKTDFSPGRSAFTPLEINHSHVIVELPENARVLEVLEVDGRTTLFIDDVPYRLDGDTLRRADKIDIGDTPKALPCRIRRALGADVCQTRYVIRTPGPTPHLGVFDETKSWAPWFGNSIYTPAPNRMPISRTSLAAHSTLEATMEFQTGIYGRVKVRVPTPEQDFFHTFNAGAVIVEAIDDSKHYLFTRLNAGDFYVAEVTKGQSLRDALIFRKASSLPDEVRKELLVVYTGSLNANNTVRIHGLNSVERAVKTMEEIAIPIGGHANPPETLKWLKVDTSPGEAAMFDHRSRMIISKLPEGATSWTRSKDAPEALRQRTAEIFDTLFLEPVITLRKDSALKIDATMQRLQKLIPRRQRPHNARNIAYAQVTTAAGKQEVYVSVSGAQGATAHLPLFKHNGGTHPVIVGETTYFNIDHNQSFPSTALNVTEDGKLLAVPRTIDNIDTYRPELTSRPTSLDSESKLISVIRKKYPDRTSIKSVDVATTMPPCDSCSVVMKEFAYDGGENALQVLWK
ncbi:deaminase domain-containing protein [Pseudomonas sp. TH03]|uniref:deaminase domain-containing protein n=1 Tax=Pseudomonas sp. TH03 TaxID=2796369 RepID=UPI001F5B0F14|nr:deaminase domain-containing protein [Pseudomonas sp. TH03]